METFSPQNDSVQEHENLLTPGQVGARIRQLRKGKHLTQAQVATAAGVSRQFVSALERGHDRAEVGMVLAVGGVVGLRVG